MTEREIAAVHERLLAERAKVAPLDDVQKLTAELAKLDCYFSVTVRCADGQIRHIERRADIYD